MPAPWDETRLTQAAEVAAEHGCASAVDVESLVAECRRLRGHLAAIEGMASRHEESAEWKASAAIPAIMGRARRALRGLED